MAQVIRAPRQRDRERRGGGPSRKPPVLATTRYDLVSALIIALVIALVLLLVWVFALWLANRRIETESSLQIEMVQLGGYEDGAPDETLKVESPADPSDDPSVVDAFEERQVQDVIENVVELSNTAARQVPQQTETAPENTGKLGSAEGTGRRPLGSGGGPGNLAQHWYIRFGDRGTLAEYARQLDYFHVELGLLVGNRIERLSNLSGSVQRRTYHSGKELKNQWYFTWAGGGRKQADIKLLKQKGKLPADRGTIFHFYRQQEINLLAALEKAAAKKDKKSRKNIARTYFAVVRKGGGYEFVVTKIVYE